MKPGSSGGNNEYDPGGLRFRLPEQATAALALAMSYATTSRLSLFKIYLTPNTQPSILHIGNGLRGSFYRAISFS